MLLTILRFYPNSSQGTLFFYSIYTRKPLPNPPSVRLSISHFIYAQILSCVHINGTNLNLLCAVMQKHNTTLLNMHMHSGQTVLAVGCCLKYAYIISVSNALYAQVYSSTLKPRKIRRFARQWHFANALKMDTPYSHTSAEWPRAICEE